MLMPKKAQSLLAALLVLSGLLGCSRTVIGGFVDSPTQKYRMFGRVFGAYGRAFADRTRKTVRITIVLNDPNERVLLRKNYEVVGADVGWDVIWSDDNNLSVTIYDGGPISSTASSKTHVQQTSLKTIKYRFDPKSGTFKELSGSSL